MATSIANSDRSILLRLSIDLGIHTRRCASEDPAPPDTARLIREAELAKDSEMDGPTPHWVEIERRILSATDAARLVSVMLLGSPGVAVVVVVVVVVLVVVAVVPPATAVTLALRESFVAASTTSLRTCGMLALEG